MPQSLIAELYVFVSSDPEGNERFISIEAGGSTLPIVFFDRNIIADITVFVQEMCDLSGEGAQLLCFDRRRDMLRVIPRLPANDQSTPEES